MRTRIRTTSTLGALWLSIWYGEYQGVRQRWALALLLPRRAARFRTVAGG